MKTSFFSILVCICSNVLCQQHHRTTPSAVDVEQTRRFFATCHKVNSGSSLNYFHPSEYGDNNLQNYNYNQQQSYRKYDRKNFESHNYNKRDSFDSKGRERDFVGNVGNTRGTFDSNANFAYRDNFGDGRDVNRNRDPLDNNRDRFDNNRGNNRDNNFQNRDPYDNRGNFDGRDNFGNRQNSGGSDGSRDPFGVNRDRYGNNRQQNVDNDDGYYYRGNNREPQRNNYNYGYNRDNTYNRYPTDSRDRYDEDEEDDDFQNYGKSKSTTRVEVSGRVVGSERGDTSAYFSRRPCTSYACLSLHEDLDLRQLDHLRCRHNGDCLVDQTGFVCVRYPSSHGIGGFCECPKFHAYNATSCRCQLAETCDSGDDREGRGGVLCRGGMLCRDSRCSCSDVTRTLYVPQARSCVAPSSSVFAYSYLGYGRGDEDEHQRGSWIVLCVVGAVLSLVVLAIAVRLGCKRVCNWDCGRGVYDCRDERFFDLDEQKRRHVPAWDLPTLDCASEEDHTLRYLRMQERRARAQRMRYYREEEREDSNSSSLLPSSSRSTASPLG